MLRRSKKRGCSCELTMAPRLLGAVHVSSTLRITSPSSVVSTRATPDTRTRGRHGSGQVPENIQSTVHASAPPAPPLPDGATFVTENVGSM